MAEYQETQTLDMDEHLEEIDEGSYETEDASAAVSDGADAAGADEARKKKSNLITMAIVGAVLVGFGGVAANKFGLLGGGASAPAQGEPAPTQKQPDPAPVQQEQAPMPQEQVPAGTIAGMVSQPAEPAAEPEGFARGFAALTEKVDQLYQSVANLQNLNIGERLTRLEERVAALESGKSGYSAGTGTAAPAKKAKKIKKKAKPAAQMDGIVEMHGDVVEVSGYANPKQANAAVDEAASESESFALQAVIPGSMWVKMRDGSSLDYEVGEILPNGSKVLQINAEDGVVKTSKGILE